MQPSWVLASSSRRRRELLQVILPISCISPNIEEVHAPSNHPPIWVPQTNAHRKASWGADRFPDAYVIGADTVVILHEIVFNKPKDLEEAKHMLQTLSGKTHQAITGLEIIRQTTHFRQAITVATNVTFDVLTESFIESYLQQTNPLTVAGAYAIHFPITQTFVHLQGSRSNVEGFPLEAFREIFGSIQKV